MAKQTVKQAAESLAAAIVAECTHNLIDDRNDDPSCYDGHRVSDYVENLADSCEDMLADLGDEPVFDFDARVRPIAAKLAKQKLTITWK